nr:MAG TPA: tail protein [Caudoviricetes sp.]
MTQATPKDYWISPNALFIEKNALDNPDYIQASCASGAQILVYVKDVISYDAGHNYRRWKLQAVPTVFNTHTEKYVYVAIPRDMDSNAPALVVFPSEKIDIYGLNAEGEQVGSDKYYYIFLQGVLTSSGDNGTVPRDWKQGCTIVSGYLSSDEALSNVTIDTEWYKYSSANGRVTFLKDITMEPDTKFLELYAQNLTIVSGGGIAFADQSRIVGVADSNTDVNSTDRIATPKYVADKFLSRVHDDKAQGYITFAKGMESAELATFGKGVMFGNSFASGLTGFGGRIDGHGIGELEALRLRRWLEVPELRFNRISIYVGNNWRAAGGGIIERVVPDVGADGTELQRGTVYLKLEDGEIGKVAVDDICMGIWHDDLTQSNNSTDDYDDGIGNFRFGGFFTSYFRIVEVMSVDGGINNAFRYVLRSDKHWKALHHPASMMHFVAYGNFTDKTRQSSRYSTLTYERYLKDVNDWEFTEDNIAAQFGDLSNLSIFGLNMTGYSAYLNNIYMSGTIQQFEKLGRKMHIDQSLGGYMAPGEVETVTVSILDGYMQDHTEEYTFMVERDTGDTAADDVWNAMPEHINCGSAFKIAFEDLHINPNHGGISTLFHVTADNGKEEEKVSTAIEY